MFRTAFALLVRTLGTYIHLSTYMTTMLFFRRPASFAMSLYPYDLGYSHPSTTFPHLILHSWVSILCHLMGTRVAETRNQMQPEEFSLLPLCWGLPTREKPHHPDTFLSQHLQSPGQARGQTQEFRNPDLPSFEATSHLQRSCQKRACRAHCGIVIPYLAFKTFQFTADTAAKQKVNSVT